MSFVARRRPRLPRFTLLAALLTALAASDAPILERSWDVRVVPRGVGGAGAHGGSVAGAAASLAGAAARAGGGSDVTRVDALLRLGADALASAPEPSRPSRAFPLTAADGTRFTCSVGGAGAAVAGPPSPATAAAKRAADAARALDEAAAAGGAPACVVRTFSFWTYEVCPGRRVRQFHREAVGYGAASGDGAGAGAGAEGGVAGADPAAATAATAGVVLATTSSFELGAFVEGSSAVRTVASGALVLEQAYAGGTDGRRATVVVDCDVAPSGGGGGGGGAPLELTAVEEPAPLHYVLRLASRDRGVCALLPSPARLLAPLAHTCVEHTEGWWTYELCLGGRLRQYHAEPVAAAAGAGGGAGGSAVLQESVIGDYDAAAGVALEPAVGGGGALVQRYVGGSPCDVRRGAPRSGSVRFECAPAGSPAHAGALAAGRALGGPGDGGAIVVTLTLVSVRESPTCEYTVVFATPLVCAHPAVVPPERRAAAAPVRRVECVPDGPPGGAGEVEGAGEYGGDVDEGEGPLVDEGEEPFVGEAGEARGDTEGGGEGGGGGAGGG